MKLHEDTSADTTYFRRRQQLIATSCLPAVSLNTLILFIWSTKCTFSKLHSYFIHFYLGLLIG